MAGQLPSDTWNNYSRSPIHPKLNAVMHSFLDDYSPFVPSDFCRTGTLHAYVSFWLIYFLYSIALPRIHIEAGVLQQAAE